MLIINSQPISNCAFGIVFTLLQRLAANIIQTLLFRRVVNHVIDPPRTRMHATTSNSLHQLFIFDLRKSKSRPEVTLEVTTDRSACTCVAFNPTSPELLASADAEGAVKIWRLSTLLSEAAPHELEALDAMASAGEVRDAADVTDL